MFDDELFVYHAHHAVPSWVWLLPSVQEENEDGQMATKSTKSTKVDKQAKYIASCSSQD